MEAEALLLGIWKNVSELEDMLTLEELDAILKASRDREHRRNKFMAAMQGIDIDAESEEDAQERFDRIQRRAEALIQGVSVEKLEFDELGLDVEEE